VEQPAAGVHPWLSASTNPRTQILGKGAARELRCSAIHPEIPQRGIEGLRPSLPGRQRLAFDFEIVAASFGSVPLTLPLMSPLPLPL